MNSSNSPWKSVSRFLLICLGLLIVGFVAVLLFGSVRGRQISPQTFEMRLYEYYRIPWSAIQITPVQYTSIPNDLVSFLADEGYLPNDAAASWDEVSYSASGTEMQRGRAWVLASFLEMEDADRENWWLDWSEQHPEKAKVLWKYVAQAARDRIYFVIPELMVSAKSEKMSIEALEDGLLSSMKLAYSQQIAASSLAEQHDRVKTLNAALESMTTNR